MQFLIKDLPAGYAPSLAHVWDENDTHCKMWSNGNCTNKKKWLVRESNEEHRICKTCIKKLTGEDKDISQLVNSNLEAKNSLQSKKDMDWEWPDLSEQLQLKGAARELCRNLQLTTMEDQGGAAILMNFIVPHELMGLCTNKILNQINDAVNDHTNGRMFCHYTVPAGSECLHDKKTYKQESEEFLQSWEWTELRYKVLDHYGRECMSCGATKDEGAVMCVDHIKPRAKYPELKLVFENLQVLCHDCNKGKGARDETDFRGSRQDNGEYAVEADLHIKITATVDEIVITQKLGDERVNVYIPHEMAEGFELSIKKAFERHAELWAGHKR